MALLAGAGIGPASLAGPARQGRPLRRDGLPSMRARRHAALLPRSAPRVGAPPARSLQLARFQGSTAAEPAVEEELIQLPYDCTELLGLSGHDTYLYCDITRAYDELLASGVNEGYSSAILDARQQLLALLKELAIRQEGRVGGAGGAANKQVTIPVSLLPSALVLLAQLGHDDTIIDMASSLLDNWEYRKAHKADLVLALAVAYCNKARELLREEQVAKGCQMLEEALHVLDATDRSAAPQLVREIRAGLASLQGPRILDTLRGPLPSPSSAGGGDAARRKAVLAVRGMATAAAAGGGGGVLTQDYVRLLVGSAAAQEVLEMADWQEVARKDKGLPWVYPGLLLTVAAAHVVEGFTGRDPALVRSGLALMRHQPDSAELLALRGIGCLLLGVTDGAAAAFRDAAKAPRDAADVLPLHAEQQQQPPAAAEGELHGTGGALPGAAQQQQHLDLVLPGASGAYGFIQANSPEAPQDLLPGMCLYAELWLQRVGSRLFRGAQDQHRADPSINAYFSSGRVQAQLADAQQQRDAAGLGGGAAAALALRKLGGALSSAGDGAAALAAAGLGRLHEQLAAAAGAGSDGASSLAHRVAGALAPAAAAGSGDGSGAGAAAAAFGGAVAGGWAERQEAWWWPRGWLALPRPARAAAAAGLLLVAAAAGAGLLRAASRGASPCAASSADAAAATSPRFVAMDASGAARLIEQFQRAKARALGSEYDCSQLSGILMGHALQQYLSTAQELAARGWFRSSRLWKVVVHRVTPVTPSGQRVVARATIGEEALTWGFDGQNTCRWSNEYDVDYELTLCKGGAWRISRLTVRGTEPGARGFKLPFFGGGGGGGGGGAGGGGAGGGGGGGSS